MKPEIVSYGVLLSAIVGAFSAILVKFIDGKFGADRNKIDAEIAFRNDLLQRVARLETELRTVERENADWREKYFNAMSEMQDWRSKAEELQAEVDNLNTKVDMLQQKLTKVENVQKKR